MVELAVVGFLGSGIGCGVGVGWVGVGLVVGWSDEGNGRVVSVAS